MLRESCARGDGFGECIAVAVKLRVRSEPFLSFLLTKVDQRAGLIAARSLDSFFYRQIETFDRKNCQFFNLHISLAKSAINYHRLFNPI
jgi:hypothetical protein